MVKEREKYEEQFQRLNQLIAEHTALSTSEAALEREVDLLRHQIHEIDAAQLRADEEEELLARYNVGANSRRLMELATRQDFSIVDVDRLMACAGAERLKVDMVHLKAEGLRLVAEEVVRILEERGCFDVRGP